MKKIKFELLTFQCFNLARRLIFAVFHTLKSLHVLRHLKIFIFSCSCSCIHVHVHVHVHIFMFIFLDSTADEVQEQLIDTNCRSRDIDIHTFPADSISYLLGSTVVNTSFVVWILVGGKRISVHVRKSASIVDFLKYEPKLQTLLLKWYDANDLPRHAVNRRNNQIW